MTTRRMRTGNRLDAFTRQYIETALWSSMDESDDATGGDPLDQNYSSDDIDPATMKQMIADCASFQEKFADLLSESGIDDEKAGHRFWLARNGHGVSFEDDESTPSTEALQAGAEEYGNFDLYLGDDGKIHGSGEGRAVGESRRTSKSAQEITMRQDDARDERWVTVYDEDAIKMMPGWTGGQTDPLYAISSTGGANYAWVIQDAIANLNADLKKVKKVGKKYQLGKGEFTKAEIDELYTIRDALVDALRDTPPESAPWTRVAEHHVADFSTLPEIIAHAQKEGATHVLLAGRHTSLFFPTENGRYEEARVWREAGYWHAEAREKRVIVDGLPKGAEPIENPQQMTEAHQTSLEVVPSQHGGYVLRYPNGTFWTPSGPLSWPPSMWNGPTSGRWTSLEGAKRALDNIRRGKKPESDEPGVSESHMVRDYVAVDNRGRVVGGPYTDYSQAKRSADQAHGHVEFKMKEGVAAWHRPSSHGEGTEKRAAWMRAFSDAAVALGAHPGQLLWQDAVYLFSQGMDAQTAANKLYGGARETRQRGL